MPSSYSPSPPDRDVVQLRIMDEHVTMNRWVGYSFASDFLTPTDGWSFEIGDEDLPESHRDALRLGARVQLRINNVPVTDGHIDSIEISAARGRGTVWNIAGRDRIALAVDAVADPTLAFKPGATLAEVLQTLFAPFGWLRDDQFVVDNDANRDASTGVRGIKRGKGRKNFGQPLKSYKVHQLKPYNHEGVFAFASRVAQRQGLWIWSSNDGEQIIVGKPEFEQEPLYELRRGRGKTNVLDGSVRFDATDQPAMIIADGFSGGGEFGRGRIKAYAINPYFGVDADGFVLDELTAALARFPGAEQVSFVTQPFKRRSPRIAPPRIAYLHDDESKTPDQLAAFVRREMSLLLRKSFTCEYTVEGHGQTIDGEFRVWAVDTTVQVRDEVAGVDELMWVLGVRFEKSRHGGTHTRLHLVRLNSIVF